MRLSAIRAAQGARAVCIDGADGRTVPASDVPWMRCREVWVHAVGLDAGAGFDDMADDVLTSVIDDDVATWGWRDQHPRRPTMQRRPDLGRRHHPRRGGPLCCPPA